MASIISLAVIIVLFLFIFLLFSGTSLYLLFGSIWVIFLSFVVKQCGKECLSELWVTWQQVFFYLKT